ncbi:MAG: hypothetical protein K8T89_23480 [Planctomycetes bacterium]|nr:hypothetical protein [Planctomycetota bacterium]
MKWSEVLRKPTTKVLRQFAVCWLVVFGAWSISVGLSAGLSNLAIILGSVALGIALPGLLAPATIGWLFTAAMIVTFPIGWVVSRVLLSVVYYAVFTPFSLVFCLIGRDALRLKPQTQASCWIPRAATADPARYFRQF